MKRFIAKVIATLGLTFCSFQASSQGLNLNPALLGCIMSGGDCLANSGIPILEDFFSRAGKHELYTRDDECRDLKGWCSGNGGYWGSGYVACRETKMAYYKQQAQKKGTWPKEFHYIDGDPEMKYFREVEKSMAQNPPWVRDYFTCNAKQRELYMKARCGLDFTNWQQLGTDTIHCNKDR